MEKKIILNIKNKIKEGHNLSFIHTPKCAGTYASQYMDFCKIPNKRHNRKNNDDDITFTIIRDPVKRFESFLNYRLEKRSLPKNIQYAVNDKKISLDEIIRKINKIDITSMLYSPYMTLTYWTYDVDLLITIEELEETLKLLGYNIDNCVFDKKNISKKERGTLNNESIEKIKKLYEDDVKLYNLWTRK